jgi:hypothetical protein
VIGLQPELEVDLTCPRCNARLEPLGWTIPGMRTLADLACEHCSRRFFGDLPSGFGLMYPCLVDQESGEVYDPYGGRWFAEWLAEAWRTRSSAALPLKVESAREPVRPVLLNCLDGLYGHSLLKLLNAQYYLDQTPEHDLVVMVTPALRWLVPEGVAEVWVLDVEPRQARGWSDWLAGRVADRFGAFEELSLSLAVPHPDPSDYTLERFTGVEPRETGSAAGKPPVVTFAWRPDRTWRPRVAGRSERRALEWLVRRLRRRFGEVDFALCGIGEPGGVGGVRDLRRVCVSPEVELEWCRRYAASDVVLGIHGSNMLLPSGHAPAVIELVPADRLGNVAQSLLPRADDLRDALFRYRLLPASSSPATVATVVETLIGGRTHAAVTFGRRWTDHRLLAGDPNSLRRTRHGEAD